jgi:type I restriction enzyme S subunit
MYYPFIPLTKGTTARRKLTQQSLMSAPVMVPSLVEQERIVAAVEAVFSSLNSVEVEVENAAKVITGLRQAILREAFLGTLVPQDATDESASTLIERIVAERSVSPKRVGTKLVRKKKVKA